MKKLILISILATLGACSTSKAPTLQEQIGIAQLGVSAACDAADVLVQAGDIHGQDAANVAAGCAAARDVLATLLASVPSNAVSTPAPASSSPAS